MVGPISWLLRLLPPLPSVPLLLWATLAGLGLAGLNLAFYQEIWSGPEQTGKAITAIALLLVMLGAQTVGLLWRWPEPVAAPLWWRTFFWLGTRLAAVGLATGLVLLGLGVLVGLIILTGFSGQN